MIYYVPIAFILAILGTFLPNPIFIYNLVKKRIKGLTVVFWLKQLIAFIVVFIFSIIFLYIVKRDAIIISTLLISTWISGMVQLFIIISIDEIYILDINGSCDYDETDNLAKSQFVLLLILFIIPILLECSKTIYNYNNTSEAFSSLYSIEEIPNIEDSTNFNNIKLVDGAIPEAPMYRNNTWIYPVIVKSKTVPSPGYIISSTDYDVTFVNSPMNYSPYLTGKNNIYYYCRRILPTKVFFGEAFFEVNPVNGEIYFAQFFGNYKNIIRGGREIQGCIVVNATNGNYKIYKTNSIPEWITGYSF